ncbi:hypothetical protein LCY76_17635 [Fictibacillus sp. KIGAM418]|uniref:Uncharacterized protein n=1 Tax=Fictibacillus marinisediminis TaxID=2878389 RepID=A0A9X2BDZ3_9BACL|nr:hypothetical protein [Fictibacillus marinisediminis]MCK6258399.1 hypothetical protein [Fictibacillus marinisediminis]
MGKSVNNERPAKLATDEKYNVFTEVKVYTHDAGEVEAVSKKIEKLAYSTYSAQNELKEINIVFLIIKIGLITVGTVAVLIASIGIFNDDNGSH